MRNYLYQLWLVFNQFINALFGGWADETISARCYREQRTLGIRILNTLYFWQDNHCLSAYQNEKDRKHLPVVYRNEREPI